MHKNWYKKKNNTHIKHKKTYREYYTNLRKLCLLCLQGGVKNGPLTPVSQKDIMTFTKYRSVSS